MTLTRTDLWSLEEYAEKRPSFRSEVIDHKKARQVRLGGHLTLLFEDQLTIRYQVQEMLRIERVFEAAGIQDELDAYNPLIPDGDNLKATMMIEYDDPEERRVKLGALRGIEDRVWLRVGDLDKVHALADEDLERSNEEKTSAVHFLRFQFTEAMITALKAGADLVAGVDHDAYPTEPLVLSGMSRDALTADFA